MKTRNRHLAELTAWAVVLVAYVVALALTAQAANLLLILPAALAAIFVGQKWSDLLDLKKAAPAPVGKENVIPLAVPHDPAA